MAKRKTKKEQIEDKIIFLKNLGKEYSKKNRNNANKWESSLFNTLSELHYKFKFQVPYIVNKTKNPQLFILDFLLTDYNIILEADGKQHYTKENIKKDNKRSKFLKKEGFHILRLSNKQISSFTRSDIDQIIKTKITISVNKS